MLPWRCPVYRWRDLVVGAGMEQENLLPWRGWLVLVDRSAGGRTIGGCWWESTDAGRRGGPARSSGDGPVMGSERRGRTGLVTLMSTRLGRS